MTSSDAWTGARSTWAEQPNHWKEIVARLSGGVWSRSLPWDPPETVFWVGEGSSLHAAALTGAVLGGGGPHTRWGRPPRWDIACAASEFAQMAGRLSGPKQWFVGFSHRGQTATTVKALKQARARGFYTVWVASQAIEQPPAEVDLFLPAGPLETVEPHTSAVTSAVVAATTVLGDGSFRDIWLAAILGDRIAQPELPESIQGLKDGAWVVSHGAGEWLAREFALKCLELGGPQLRPSASEAFFHGPSLFLPQRGQKTQVLWLDSSEDPREDDWQGRYRPEGLDIRVQSLGGLASDPRTCLQALVRLQGWALAISKP